MLQSIFKTPFAIIGGGIFCKAFLEYFLGPEFEGQPPQILGVADRDSNAPGLIYAREKELFTTTDYHELFSLEHLEIILEMTSDPLFSGTLRQIIPAHISIVDHFEVQALWDEAEERRTPAEWALRWIWNHPEVTVVLSGMNEEAHVEENIRIAGDAYPRSFTEEDLQLVRRAEETYRALMKAGCTGCRYCMPCPSGVDIPTCLEVYDSMYLSGDRVTPKFIYHLRVGGVPFEEGNRLLAGVEEGDVAGADLLQGELGDPLVVRIVLDDEVLYVPPAISRCRQCLSIPSKGYANSCHGKGAL